MKFLTFCTKRIVKLWFTTIFYVIFNSVSNLIVFLFNHFLVFFVGFYIRALCESLVKNLWISGFHDCWPAKHATWEAHAGIWRVLDMLDFASNSRLRLSREWPAKLTACYFLECDFSHSLPTLYKSLLSTKCKKKEYF